MLTIQTDGSCAGTKLLVDGTDITQTEKVIDISCGVMTPFKSKFSGETIDGYCRASYSVIDSEGKVKTVSIGSDKTLYNEGIGNKIENTDSIIRFIGAQTDKVMQDIIDEIIKFCDENKITCPTKDQLYNRSLESLKDKYADLGLKKE